MDQGNNTANRGDNLLKAGAQRVRHCSEQLTLLHAFEQRDGRDEERVMRADKTLLDVAIADQVMLDRRAFR